MYKNLVSQSVSQSVIQSVGLSQSVSQSVSRSVSQSAVSQSAVSQSVSQSVSPSSSQSSSPPVNWEGKKQNFTIFCLTPSLLIKNADIAPVKARFEAKRQRVDVAFISPNRRQEDG